MINDNNLENRLNAAKDGKEIPIPEKTLSYVKEKNTEINQIDNVIENISLKHRILTELILILNSFFVAILYGYGFRGILSTDWNFLESMGVGLIISHLISRYIPKFYNWISNLFTKPSI